MGKALLVSALYVFLLAPIVIVVLASFDYGPRAFVVFPPEHLSLDSYRNIPAAHFRALGVSVAVGLTVACLAAAIGVPAALGIVRGEFRAKGAVMALFRAPLQIPGVVTGLAFLQAYYAIGHATGFYANGSFPGLVAAHTFAATPYVVGTLVPTLQRFNPALEEAALVLGASRWSAFRRVTLPIIMPGIFGGMLYAFMISFSDVPIAVFIASASYTTFPVEVFLALQQEFEPTLFATSSIVVVLSVVVLLLIQRIAGLGVFVKTQT